MKELDKYTPEYLKSLSIADLESLDRELAEINKPIRAIRIAIGEEITRKHKDAEAEKILARDPDLAAALARKAQDVAGSKVDSEEKVNAGG